MLVLQKQQRNRGVWGAYIGMNGGSYRHTVTRDLLFLLNPATICYFDLFLSPRIILNFHGRFL